MTVVDLLLPPPGSVALPILVAAPCWLATNVLLGAASWRMARRLLPGAAFAEALSSALVIGWACVVGVSLILGSAGWLSGVPLLLAVAALSIAALITPGPAPPAIPRPSRFWRPFWLGMACLGAGQAIVCGLWRFPSDWDSLAYHLPMVDHWLRAGCLFIPDCARWSDPGNNELLALWAVAPFSGDFLAGLNNLPTVVLFASSAFALARCLGLQCLPCHLFALVAVFHHVVLTQLVDAENDVAVAALFLTVLMHAVRHANTGSWGHLSVGAASLGLLAGVKFYALGYAALALVAWIPLAALSGRRWRSVAVSCGIGCLTLGGYWYIRNLLVTGSPLYPRDFLVHPDMLATLYPQVAQSSFVGNGRPELPGLYLRSVWVMLGPIHAAAVLLAPIILGWLVVSSGWDMPTVERRGRLALAALTVGTALLLLITPFAVEDEPGTLNQMHWHYCPVRYGLCFLTLTTLALVFSLWDVWQQLRRSRSIVRRTVQTILLVALVAALSWQVYRAHEQAGPERTDALLLGVALWAIGLMARSLENSSLLPSRLATLLAVLFSLIGICWGAASLEATWHSGFARHFDWVFGGESFSYLEQEKPPDPLCVCDHRHYPYMGSRRQFRVVQPIHVVDAGQFLAMLHDLHIGIIVAAPRRPPSGWQSFAGVGPALRQHPKRFRKVAETGGTIVYAVSPG